MVQTTYSDPTADGAEAMILAERAAKRPKPRIRVNQDGSYEYPMDADAMVSPQDGTAVRYDPASKSFKDDCTNEWRAEDLAGSRPANRLRKRLASFFRL